MTDTALDLTEGTTLIAMAVGPESGVVQVVGREVRDGKDYVVVRNDAASMSVPLANVGKLLRLPVSRDQALRWLSRLRDTETAVDERAWPERYADYHEALLTGADDRFVELLRRLYASPYAASQAERRLIWTFERILVEEIALVLELKAAELVDELHAGHAATGAFAASAGPRP